MEPALGQHEQSSIHEDPFLDDIIKEGVIQRFEHTHELAWNVMKDFLKEVGNTDIYGSKDATRAAFEAGLIEKGDVWMDMIRSRNKASHAYNEATTDEIFLQIIREYLEVFLAFRDKIQTLQEKRTHEVRTTQPYYPGNTGSAKAASSGGESYPLWLSC